MQCRPLCDGRKYIDIEDGNCLYESDYEKIVHAGNVRLSIQLEDNTEVNQCGI